MIILSILAAMSVLAVAYAAPMWGGKSGKTRLKEAGLIDWLEPIERKLWWNSETIFMARFKMFIGTLSTALINLGAIDLSPFVAVLPEEHRGWVTVVVGLIPMIVTLLGWLDQSMRFDTTKPPELVAIRTDASEEVKRAKAEADAAVAYAVALAKAEGAV